MEELSQSYYELTGMQTVILHELNIFILRLDAILNMFFNFQTTLKVLCKSDHL